MKLTLHTEFVIDSMHYLRNYVGACQRQHGHSWFVDVYIRGDELHQDKVGIMFDFGRVKELREEFDHQNINEIVPFDTINPTAENLSKHFYHKLKAMRPELEFKVRIYETKVGKETWCEVGDWN